MTDQRRSFWQGVMYVILVGVQIVLIPVLFAFDTRINNLENESQRINNIEKKVDHLIDLMEKGQQAQTEFYKEYAAALEYSKRQLEK